MREIQLNKQGESNELEKLEIPLDFVCEEEDIEDKEIQKSNTSQICSYNVMHNMMNSNLVIQYWFMD